MLDVGPSLLSLCKMMRHGVTSEKAFRAGQKLSPTRLQRYKATSTARNTARHGTAQTIVTDMARSTEHGTARNTARNTARHGTRNTTRHVKPEKHGTEHGTAQTIVTDKTGHGTACKTSLRSGHKLRISKTQVCNPYTKTVFGYFWFSMFGIVGFLVAKPLDGELGASSS